MSKPILSFIVFFAAISISKAQSSDTSCQFSGKNQFSVVFGLNQPIVFHGFNFEVDYWTRKWVFDYSHGFDLHEDGKSISSQYEDQKINFKIKHSVGVGIGYRFTQAFNFRFEPKMHVYETYYEGQVQTKNNSIANFTTYTLGFGAYYRWLPFEKLNNALKGITIVPSIRYWYKVASTLTNEEFKYLNAITNTKETLQAPNIGIANSPILFNVSIGYTF